MDSQKNKTAKKPTLDVEKKEDETLQFSIDLQNNYLILLDNNEGLWQAKLLGNGEVISTINLLNQKHTKVVIKHFEYYSKLVSYDVDQIVGKKDNQEISDYLSALFKNIKNA